MPQVAPGAQKTARVPITVMPSGLSCQAELYLVSDSTKVVTSGLIPFTSTGAAQDITFPIIMPGATGTYKVYLDIFVSDIRIAAYIATEDVIVGVAVAPLLEVLSLTWNSLSFLPGSTHSAVLRVRNPTTLSWTYLIKLLIGPEEKASWTQVVAAGQTVDLTAVVIMPAAEGCYAVTVKVVETSTSTDLGIFLGESITIAAPVVDKLTIVSLSFIYYHTGRSGILDYNDYTVQVQIRNDGNVTSSHIIGFEEWTLGYPALPNGYYYPPIIIELNRVSLSPGQVQTITLRKSDGSLFKILDLLWSIQGTNTGVRVRALLDSDINSFSSEMFSTLF